MGLSTFTDIKELSNAEISESIIEAEKKLFNLRFKQATRQNFKSHEIKLTKRRIAQLNTLLTLKVQNFDEKDENLIKKLITN